MWIRVLSGIAVVHAIAAGPAFAAKTAAEKKALLARICSRLEAEAQAHKLPPAFFARLIWAESGFNPNAVSHKGAQGIAQFMPATAKERGLVNAFDPVPALAASASFLSDLRDQFGNLGLAAAAYNAGPGRVGRWRSGKSTLPGETRNYVRKITGLEARDWLDVKPKSVKFRLDPKLDFQTACRKLRVRFTPARSRTTLAAWQPWGVHIGAERTRGAALASYRKLQQRYPKILAKRQPLIIRKMNFSFRHHMNNILLGAANRKQAEKLCASLKRSGGLCLVEKN